MNDSRGTVPKENGSIGNVREEENKYNNYSETEFCNIVYMYIVKMTCISVRDGGGGTEPSGGGKEGVMLDFPLELTNI